MKKWFSSVIQVFDRIVIFSTFLTVVILNILFVNNFFSDVENTVKNYLIYFFSFLTFTVVVVSLFYISAYIPLRDYFRKKIQIGRINRFRDKQEEVKSLLSTLGKLEENKSGIAKYFFDLLKKDFENVGVEFSGGEAELSILIDKLSAIRSSLKHFVKGRDGEIDKLKKVVDKEVYKIVSRILNGYNRIIDINSDSSNKYIRNKLLSKLFVLVACERNETIPLSSSIGSSAEVIEGLNKLKSILANIETLVAKAEILAQAEDIVTELKQIKF